MKTTATLILLIVCSLFGCAQESLEQVTFFEAGELKQRIHRFYGNDYGLTLYTSNERRLLTQPWRFNYLLFDGSETQSIATIPTHYIARTDRDLYYFETEGDRLNYRFHYPDKSNTLLTFAGSTEFRVVHNHGLVHRDTVYLVFTHNGQQYIGRLTPQNAEVEELYRFASSSPQFRPGQLAVSNKKVAFIDWDPVDYEAVLKVIDLDQGNQVREVQRFDNRSNLRLESGNKRIYGYSDDQGWDYWYLDSAMTQTKVVLHSATLNKRNMGVVNDTVYLEQTTNDSVFLVEFYDSSRILHRVHSSDQSLGQLYFGKAQHGLYITRNTNNRNSTWRYADKKLTPLVLDSVCPVPDVTNNGVHFHLTSGTHFYDPQNGTLTNLKYRAGNAVSWGLKDYLLYTEIYGHSVPQDILELDPITKQLKNVTDSLKGDPQNEIGNLTQWQDNLYLSVYLPDQGLELWKTAGPHQEVRITNINVGNASTESSSPLLSSSQGVYFIAKDNTETFQLWRSKGTENSTAPLTKEDLGVHLLPNVGAFFGHFSLTEINGIDYVSYDRHLFEIEPHDRSTAPLAGYNNIRYTIQHLDQTLFARQASDNKCHFIDSRTQQDLYHTCAAPIGTSLFSGMISWGYHLFFIGHDEQYGPEIWTYSGNGEVQLFEELIPGKNLQVVTNSNGIKELITLQPHLLGKNQHGLYAYTRNNDEFWLWKLGPGKKTFKQVLTRNGQTLFFWSTNTLFLWNSESKALEAYHTGTNQIEVLKSFELPSKDRLLGVHGNRLYFTQDDALEIWSSDGTVNGTQRLASIDPRVHQVNWENILLTDDYLYLEAYQRSSGQQLYRLKLPEPISNTVSTGKLQLYPNPTTNYLIIDNLPEGEQVELKFYDLQGKLALDLPVRFNGTIPTQSLFRGMYIVRYELQGETYTEKIQIY